MNGSENKNLVKTILKKNSKNFKFQILNLLHLAKLLKTSNKLASLNAFISNCKLILSSPAELGSEQSDQATNGTKTCQICLFSIYNLLVLSVPEDDLVLYQKARLDFIDSLFDLLDNVFLNFVKNDPLFLYYKKMSLIFKAFFNLQQFKIKKSVELVQELHMLLDTNNNIAEDQDELTMSVNDLLPPKPLYDLDLIFSNDLEVKYLIINVPVILGFFISVMSVVQSDSETGKSLGLLINSKSFVVEWTLLY